MMMMNTEIRDFVLPSAPAKTLWFEFLFVDGLLENHIKDVNCDPTPVELVIQFLNHANSVSPLVPTGPVLIPTHTEGQGDGPVVILGNNSNSSNGTASAVSSRSDTEGKKVFMLKLLAIKIIANYNFSLDLMEKELPLTMQFAIIEFLRKITSEADASIHLFSQVLYYQWVLRSLTQASYPVKSSKGLQMPVQMMQQIDPAFTPVEVMQTLITMLHKDVDNVIEASEKLLSDKVISQMKSVSRPTVKCFQIKKQDSSGSFFDWIRVSSVDGLHLENCLKFDLAKYFFIRDPPLFSKAYLHFSSIPKDCHHDFDHLDNYIAASYGMTHDVKPLEDKKPEEQLKSCLDSIFLPDSSSDLTFASSLNLAAASMTAEGVARVLQEYEPSAPHLLYRPVLLHLCSKIKGLKKLLGLEKKNGDEPMIQSPEEEEVLEDDDSMNEETSTDLEYQLIESTCKEQILDLATRVPKQYQDINFRWKVPVIVENSLVAVPVQLRQCILIILAKANELREAGMFAESRDLFLAVQESYGTQVTPLAELIPYEILRTELENILETNDVDETLLKKCEQFLPFDQILLEFSPLFPELFCRFLLKSKHHSLQNDFSNRTAILRLSSLLCFSARGSFSAKHSKDLWDVVVESIMDTPVTQPAVEPKEQQQHHRKRHQLRRPHRDSVKQDVDQKQASLSESDVKKLESQRQSFLRFSCSLSDPGMKSVIASCLIKMYNLVRDNSVHELSMPILPHSILWPNSIGVNQTMPSLPIISSVLKSVIESAAKEQPSDLTWIRCLAELSLVEGQYEDCMKHFLTMMTMKTSFFTFFTQSRDEEDIIERMISASNKLSCHTQSAVLQQMLQQPNYSLAFKSLSERCCFDSCDDLIACIWDITLLEFLVNLNVRRGDSERKSRAMQLIGQLELNSNNSQDILKEAANIRKRKFFQILCKKYL